MCVCIYADMYLLMSMYRLCVYICMYTSVHFYSLRIHMNKQHIPTWKEANLFRYIAYTDVRTYIHNIYIYMYICKYTDQYILCLCEYLDIERERETGFEFRVVVV